MRRTVHILIFAVLFSSVIFSGCKRRKARKPAPASSGKVEIAEEEQKLKELEEEFRKHRRLIDEKRQQLARAQEELDKMSRTVSRDDKDAWEAYQRKVKEVQDLSREVDSLSRDFDNKWEKWHEQTNAVLQKLQVVAETVKTKDVRAEVARRERLVALREKEVAERERKLAERERIIANREKDIAKREKELAKGCASFAVPSVAIPTVVAPSGGAAVSKSEAHAPLRKAEAIMARKGITMGDLGEASKIYSQAKKALRKKEYYKAKALGQQFLGVVKGIRVNRAFISVKLRRINALFVRKSKKMSASKRNKILDFFKKATDAYNDGNFRKANSYLNRILNLM